MGTKKTRPIVWIIHAFMTLIQSLLSFLCVCARAVGEGNWKIEDEKVWK